ncbi:MAG: hypothetical protein GX608_03810 [Lentisphaerae bacterium]|nr:hypothetical protein [Lentisphaerota bacterium]
MRELFAAIRSRLDAAWLMAETERLWKLELGQRSPDQRAAARRAEALLRRCGLKSVERLRFPADGKTTYQDRTMALAWTVREARLTVIRSPQPLADPVVADYARHPFHVVYGSVAAPRGGTEAPLIGEESLLSGGGARGAMVMLGPVTRPARPVLQALRQAGALGFVTDCITDRYLTPDALPWINACTEGNHWQVHADDGPFIGFTVTPRAGDALREAVRQGGVRVRVQSDARRYAAERDVVTGLLPGRDRREFWIKAHLYEPLADDNSAGVVGAAALARTLRELVRSGALPPPRFSLRLVFAQEVYGFAAYEERRGGCLRPSVLGALNFDGMPLDPARGCEVWLSPAGAPCFGDYVMEDAVAECGPLTRVPWTVEERGHYFDDQGSADPTIGIPSFWCLCRRSLWHNSAQTPAVIDPECFRDALALQGAWLAVMLGLTRRTIRPWRARAAFLAGRHLLEDARGLARAPAAGRPDAKRILAYRLEREAARLEAGQRLCPGAGLPGALAPARALRRSLLRELDPLLPRTASPGAGLVRSAASIVYARASRGVPLDLARMPKSQRFPLPCGGLYGPFVRIVALLDGRRPLGEVIRRAAWEANEALTPGQAADVAHALGKLAEYGYLRRVNRRQAS